MKLKTNSNCKKGKLPFRGCDLKIEDNLQLSKWHNLSVMELLIIIILSVILVLLTGLWLLTETIVNQELFSFRSEILTELSVPCEDLSLSPYEDQDTFDLKKSRLITSILRSGKYICSSRNFTKIIDLVIERQSRLRLARGLDRQRYFSCGNESLAPNSGNLTVAFTELSPRQNFPDGYSRVKLLWDSDSKTSYIDDSIQYQDGEITIPESRIYFVYASAHFNLSQQHSGHTNHYNRPYQLTIQIFKKLYDYEQMILGERKLVDLYSDREATSLRIGSHLKLSKNDQIYVNVSFASRIILNSKGNTFGLFPL